MQRKAPRWHWTCSLFTEWHAQFRMNRPPGAVLQKSDLNFPSVYYSPVQDSSQPAAHRNLLSLFASFRKFAADIAVIETMGYRRHSRTYDELSRTALFWSEALAGHGIN